VDHPVADGGDVLRQLVERVDTLAGVVLADERELEARRAGVDDEDAARAVRAAQWGQVQSWTSG
jgi:hypothetical protein